MNSHDPFGEAVPRRGSVLRRVGPSSLATAIVALVLAACGGVVGSGLAHEPTGQELLVHETNVANNSLGRIEKNEPIPVLKDSSDAHNQRRFVIEESDPNKLEYLELLGLDGTPIAHFTIKGQVSAMDTSETNPNQVQCVKEVREEHGNALGCGTIGMPEPNGIYGGADGAHFAFTTSGALIEWEGNFITSDQPFNIKTPVKLVLNENAEVSKTSHANIIANG